MFFNMSRTIFVIWATFEMASANAFKLDQFQILLFGKELILQFSKMYPRGTFKKKKMLIYAFKLFGIVYSYTYGCYFTQKNELI